ncbi:MAG: hypothetical protein QW698_06585 [Nitrososphaerales archaeon]
MSTLTILKCLCGGELKPYCENDDEKAIPMYRCDKCGRIIYQWP